MTLRRTLIVLLVVVLVLGVVSFVFFSVGGSAPGDGRGETVEQSVGS